MSRQYNNYGRDQINVENIQGNLVVHKQDRHRNEQILLKVVRDEIENRLASSIHNAVFLNLGKEAQPDQVKRPWDSEIKIGTKAAEAIPDDKTIAQIFDSPEIGGKLLILGQPGAGKTTTLLDLAEALVMKAEEDAIYPIPVLFNLSSWKDEKQPIRDWAIVELKSKYGVSTKLGKHWIEERVLLPLLDGLDEVAPERQEKCVLKINEFLAGEASPLRAVVCSRVAEYGNYETPLHLNGAVYLKELTDEKIQDYLMKVGRQDLWQSITQNPDLLAFVRVPLLLSMLVLAYPQKATEQWQQLQMEENSLQYLLDQYVERMLHRSIESHAYDKSRLPTFRQTRCWLVWLAGQMERVSQTEFLIEDMQPLLLNNWQQRVYEVGVGLIGGLSVGLIGGLVGGLGIGVSDGLGDGLIFRLIFWLCAGLSIGLVGGLIGLLLGLFRGLDPKIKPVEVLKWDWFGFVMISLLFGLFFGLLTGLTSGLTTGLNYGAVIGLSLGGMIALSYDSLNIKTSPNQGIKLSAINYVIVVISVGLIVGLFFEMYDWPISGLHSGMILALFIGLTVGLFFGGLVCIKHFMLRFLLYQNKLIPWNYTRFLDYSTERLLLQRVGGRYRFVHKLIQEYFSKSLISEYDAEM